MNSRVVRKLFSAIPYFERSIHEREVYVIGTKNYNLLGFQLSDSTGKKDKRDQHFKLKIRGKRNKQFKIYRVPKKKWD